jgi:hypothetical protein
VALENQPLVLAGNDRFFSAGADLNEISVLDASTAYEFSKMGQTLMTAIASFPALSTPPYPDTAWAAAWTSRSPAIIASHLRMRFLGIGERRSD